MDEPGDLDQLLLTLADHLHEHCTCRPGQPPCDACDVRGQLRGIREDLLAHRAEGRRLTARRDDALGNGAAQAARRVGCDTCAGLAAVVPTLVGYARSASSA